jgi:hypothetical protein
MNLLKLSTALGLIVFLSQAHADEGKIDFHVGCYPASSDCIEFQFSSGDGKTVLAKKDPEMTLSQGEISEAEMVKGEYGQEQLQLRFEKAAAEKFGQVTGANIGKQLVVVANGKALIAPNIQQAITGGSIVISAGIGDGNKYLDGLPWLKKMAEEKKASRESWSLFSIVSFIVLGLLLIGGSIYFAFFRKRASV